MSRGQFLLLRTDFVQQVVHAPSLAQALVALRITAPVGDPARAARVRNLPDDVRRVQGALNRFPPEQGGPGTPLETRSGLCGPLTIAAIRDFQRYWGVMGNPSGLGQRPPAPDCVVDVDGPTIAQLRLGPGSTELPVQRFMAAAPRVLGRLLRARAALAAARFGRAPGSLRVADKHFKVSEQPDAALATVANMLDAMVLACTLVPFDRVSVMEEPLGTGAGDYMFCVDSGGFWKSPTQMQQGLREDTIYVGARSRHLDDASFDYAVTHELAHFVGSSGRLPYISDLVYFHREPDKYRRMEGEYRLRNADCYAQFVFEECGQPDFRPLIVRSTGAT